MQDGRCVVLHVYVRASAPVVTTAWLRVGIATKFVLEVVSCLFVTNKRGHAPADDGSRNVAPNQWPGSIVTTKVDQKGKREKGVCMWLHGSGVCGEPNAEVVCMPSDFAHSHVHLVHISHVARQVRVW